MPANPNPIVDVVAAEYVPLTLPDGWTDESLDDYGAGRVRSIAAGRGLRLLDEPTRQHEEGVALVVLTTAAGETEEWVPLGPMVNGRCAVVPVADRDPRVCDVDQPGARLVTWKARAQSQYVQALDGATVAAVEGKDGAWTVDVPPYVRIIAVKHGLDAYAVKARAWAGERRVGLVGCVGITLDEVEIVLAPGTTRVTLEAMPEEPAEAVEVESAV